MSVPSHILSLLSEDVKRDFSFDSGYFRTAEIALIDSLDLPIQNKSVLELGSGPGFFLKTFLDKGCKTLSLEGRQTNVDAFKIVNPGSEVLIFDVENDDWTNIPPHDICFCIGLLYHLRDPEALIKKICPLVNDFLILESCVTWHNEDSLITNTVEDSKFNHQSLNGFGSRPGRKKLWNTLKQFFPFVYTPLSQPSLDDFPTDTSRVIDFDGRNKRVFFICSKVSLSSPKLTLDFVDKYI